MIIQRRDIDYTEEGHRLYRGGTSIVQRWDPDEEPRLYRGGISIIQRRDPDYTKEASILQRRDSDEGPRLYRGGTPIIQRRDTDYTEEGLRLYRGGILGYSSLFIFSRCLSSPSNFLPWQKILYKTLHST